MAISGWFNQRILLFSLVLLGVFSIFYNIHVFFIIKTFCVGYKYNQLTIS